MASWWVVPCSKAKRSHPAQARIFYEGNLHHAARVAAEADPDHGTVLILSASYGLVTLDQVLVPYDVTLGDPGQVQPATLAMQAGTLGVMPSDDVNALLPRGYFDLLAEGLAARLVYPRWVFEGCRGVGDMLAVCKQLRTGR